MNKLKCKCSVVGCIRQHNSLHRPPLSGPLRNEWLHFIFDGNIPESVGKVLFVCANHFKKECFTNLRQYQDGFAQRLKLIEGSVPSVYGNNKDSRASTSVDEQAEEEEKPSISSLDLMQPFGQKPTLYQPSDATIPPSLSSFPVMLIPGKVAESKKTKTVGTQLSLNTLKTNHFRSKAVQSTPILMSNVGVQTMKRQKGAAYLPLAKAFLAEPTGKPRKRPRVEMEGEEEEEVNDVPVFRNSTFQLKPPVMDFCDFIYTDSVPDYEDTKYIVFESNLRELFDKCPVCNGDCNVQRQKCGTFVSFSQHCPQCMYSRKWQNQPVMKSTPVGDLQLSAAIYFSGGSFQKTQRICKAMNLQIHQMDTFRRHSRMFLEPAINHEWKQHQERLFDELKEKREVALGCDLKPYSPAHSTKLGSYTTMDLENKKILDIQLVQSKETGGKVQMEKKGLKRCLDRLESSSLKVDYVVTDRHNCVQKYLQDKQIMQFYDVWRLEKDLSKRLDQLAEKKDFLVVKKWSPAIKHHMYWSAASSKSGAEKVAKWTSLVNHIQDVHTHDDPLFPKCAHPEKVSRDPNKWFKPGTKPLYEVEKLLLNKRVLHDVEKLCSDHQTSSLDLFHSTSLQFTPRNENETFSFMEMMCRLFLAAMHFNENMAHEQATCGNAFLFTNSMQGCSTENAVRTKTTYGYVRSLMRLVFTEVFIDPSSFVEDLRKAQVPRKDTHPVDHMME